MPDPTPKALASFPPLPKGEGRGGVEPSHAPRITHHASRFALSTLPRSSRSRAFTLIELMIVMAIMALVMTMSVPAIRGALRKETMRQAVENLEEVLGNARALAILRGTATQVVFHPQDRTYQVVDSVPSSEGGGGEPHGQPRASAPLPASGTMGVFPGELTLEMLDVNLIEYKDAEEARVRFYPNGTCDELTIILHDPAARMQDNQLRAISLDITTGLINVETDPRKLLSLKR